MKERVGSVAVYEFHTPMDCYRKDCKHKDLENGILVESIEKKHKSDLPPLQLVKYLKNEYFFKSIY
jgi:hypothetical protein